MDALWTRLGSSARHLCQPKLPELEVTRSRMRVAGGSSYDSYGQALLSSVRATKGSECDEAQRAASHGWRGASGPATAAHGVQLQSPHSGDGELQRNELHFRDGAGHGNPLNEFRDAQQCVDRCDARRCHERCLDAVRLVHLHDFRAGQWCQCHRDIHRAAGHCAHRLREMHRGQLFDAAGSDGQRERGNDHADRRGQR